MTSFDTMPEANFEMSERLRQTEILLKETQHRIANSLQMIASILLIKARSTHSIEARVHLQDVHQRIMQVAETQRQLHTRGYDESIEIAPYLHRLCETLSASMMGGDVPVALKPRIHGGTVLSDKASSLGLITTELVINALKHAFVESRFAGRIIVTYDDDDLTGWRLSVSDNGVGIPQDRLENFAPGLGLGLVEALAKQLDGSVQISSTSAGTKISVTNCSRDKDFVSSGSRRRPFKECADEPRPAYASAGNHGFTHT